MPTIALLPNKEGLPSCKSTLNKQKNVIADAHYFTSMSRQPKERCSCLKTPSPSIRERLTQYLRDKSTEMTFNRETDCILSISRNKTNFKTTFICVFGLCA